ncbi:MAG TPA: TatD family hydrolase [Solirubrobacteraceae bacterium]|nr:TatD family hydrolase [Solirubrobacteraceae bacterium]
MIDSHTHLDACAPPEEELVGAARSAGVTRMLTVGTDPDSCRAALAAAERFPEVYAAIGCHPNVAQQLDERLLRELAAHPRCVAIGETGLDYYRDRAPRELQQRAFEAQIELARELGKPLVIHTREAVADTLATLHEKAQGLRVILHCFSMPEHADVAIAAGWWLSFAGNVTYPKSIELAAVAARAPIERLLVETDAPYLAPQSHRGKPNEPALVVETAAFIAALRETPPSELEAALERNAAELFGW